MVPAEITKEYEAKLGDANKKMKIIGSTSDQDCSNIDGNRSDFPIDHLCLFLKRKVANKKMEIIESSSDPDRNCSIINWDMIRSWSDFPRDLLRLILERLGPIDFLICACVCKSWRSIAIGSGRQQFMDNQPPLILKFSKRTNVCRFFSLSHPDGHGSVTYKRRLPSNTFGKICVGCSRGYLFMKDFEDNQHSQLLLVNPFTGHELQFPNPCNNFLNYLLATCIKPHPQFIVIAFSSNLQFCRYGDESWTLVDTRDEFRSIEDVAVCEGKAYILTWGDASIRVLNLDSPPHLISVMKLQGLPDLSYHSAGDRFLFGASERQQLLLIEGARAGKIMVYKLDIFSQQWIRVNGIGDKTLFAPAWGWQSIRAAGLFSPPTSRMIEGYMDADVCQDCSYNMMIGLGKYSVPRINVRGIGCREPSVGWINLVRGWDRCLEYLFLWYFPSQSCTLDTIS